MFNGGKRKTWKQRKNIAFNNLSYVMRIFLRGMRAF